VLPKAVTDYLKALIEGGDVPHWHVWWRTNRAELERVLPRSAFLKLKFNGLEGGAALLEEHGVPFTWSPKGRRESALSNLHEDVVDENGERRASSPAQANLVAFAIDAFARGDRSAGEKAVKEEIGRALKVRDRVGQAEALQDLLADGEQLLAEGRRDAGVALLRPIAELRTTKALLAPSIDRAREVLESLGEKAPASRRTTNQRKRKTLGSFAQHLAEANDIVARLGESPPDARERLLGALREHLAEAAKLGRLPERWKRWMGPGGSA